MDLVPLQDFDRELRRLGAVELEIDKLQSFNNVGALSLNTQNLKLQLKNECRQWKMQYANKVHAQVCARQLFGLAFISHLLLSFLVGCCFVGDSEAIPFSGWF